MSHDKALDALIATAKVQDVPPEHAEDQAWATFAGGLGGGGGGSDLPGAAEVATAAGSKGVGLAVKVVTGIAVASVAAVGVARWAAPPSEAPVSVAPRSVPAVVATPAPDQPPAKTNPAVATREPASISEPTVSTPRPHTQAPARPRNSGSAQQATTASTSTLAEEARLVGSMWKALDRGDAQEALSLAKSYRVRFNDGALSLEARGAALAARCTLGRPTDLRELEAVQQAATPSVAKRISAACTKKP